MIINTCLHRMVTLEDLDYLVNLVVDLKPKNILEIGAAQGAVTWHFLKNSNAHVHSVDPWENRPHLFRSGDQDSDQDIELSNSLAGRKRTVAEFSNRAHSYQTKSQLVQIDEPAYFDIIWIDGDHYSKPFREDLNKWYSRLALGGVFIGHDIFYQPVRQEVIQFAEENNLTFLRPTYSIWRLK